MLSGFCFQQRVLTACFSCRKKFKLSPKKQMLQVSPSAATTITFRWKAVTQDEPPEHHILPSSRTFDCVTLDICLRSFVKLTDHYECKYLQSGGDGRWQLWARLKNLQMASPPRLYAFSWRSNKKAST